MQSLTTDEVVCFKALITIHKLLREGHRSVRSIVRATHRALAHGPWQILTEAYRELSYIRSVANQPMRSRSKGYTELIQSYVRFIVIKIEFHHTHPDFSGNMDYEDYVSLRRAQDPNEGYVARHSIIVHLTCAQLHDRHGTDAAPK